MQAFPAGLASGQSVSSLQVPAGSVPLQFRMDGFLDGVGKAEAAAGQLCTFIFYPGPAVKEGKDAGKKPLKLFSLPPVPEAENKKIFEWTVVYLGSLENVEIQANQKTLRLTHAQPVLAGQGERSFEITANGRSLAAVTVDTPENHVFVVFGDDPRELKGGLVRR